MRTVIETFSFEPEKRFESLNPRLEEFLREHGAQQGTLTVFSPHTTLCVRILEDEVLSLKDLQQHMDRVAPDTETYLHDDLLLRQVPRTERLNGHSHVRSLYYNHSETIPVSEGKMMLGEWQTVFAVELDPYRVRTLVLTYQGE